MHIDYLCKLRASHAIPGSMNDKRMFVLKSFSQAPKPIENILMSLTNAMYLNNLLSL